MPLHEGHLFDAAVAAKDSTVHHILTRAKAYAALVGAVLTAVVSTLPPDTQFWQTLSLVAAVLTAVATYAVPNADD